MWPLSAMSGVIMGTVNLSEFEVLAQPIAPGIPNVPYVQQGTFIQVTNLGQNAKLTLAFYPNPPFVPSSGAVKLFANFIDATGVPQQYNAFLTNSPVGFKDIQIAANATFLFGVQYVLVPPTINQPIPNSVGSTPQDMAATRGYIQASGPNGQPWLVLATIRQVFNNYNANTGALVDVAESAYSIPTVSGAVINT